MLKRLTATGLVLRTGAGGVVLSDSGAAAAGRVLARRRLIAAHLVEVLGVPEYDARQEAAALEHHLSPVLEARLAMALRGCGRAGDQPREREAA